jgi:hypothetical protein
MLKGFLREPERHSYLSISQSLTNTLRLKHAVVVNLPGGKKKYAPEIRVYSFPIPVTLYVVLTSPVLRMPPKGIIFSNMTQSMYVRWKYRALILTWISVFGQRCS